MRRLSLALVAVSALPIGSVQPAVAASASITPYTQQHAHGIASTWSLTWGNYAPYEVLFDRGNGTSVYWPSTFAGGSNQSYKFYPCTYTTFKQWLYVWDDHGLYADDYSWATEYGGNPC